MTAAQRQEQAFDHDFDGTASPEDYEVMNNAEFSPKREVRPTQEQTQ